VAVGVGLECGRGEISWTKVFRVGQGGHEMHSGLLSSVLSIAPLLLSFIIHDYSFVFICRMFEKYHL
jgi:hypothetical protein